MDSERLSPAMRAWQKRLAAGYTIRPAMRAGRDGYLEWGPALFNPAGGFVRNMRRDTVKRLIALGIFTPPEKGNKGK